MTYNEGMKIVLNDGARVKVSVICPFYNEAGILENAVSHMIGNLQSLGDNWELILVNDGSVDRSGDILTKVAAADPRIKVVHYPVNRGRGYALARGIKVAGGDILVTTEIDLSWGDTIVHRLVAAFDANPSCDVIIASPNLPQGGYRNVPLHRVLISRLGNIIIRLLFTKSITMNTGMTRAYRRHVIQHLPTLRTGKEFHLEVLLKLISLGYGIVEIPATLEWRDQRLQATRAKKRVSSFRLGPMIVSHLDFAIFANPIRYFWALAALFATISLAMMFGLMPDVLYTGRFFAGLGLFILSVALFAFGIVSSQNNYVLRELWRLQRTIELSDSDLHMRAPAADEEDETGNAKETDHHGPL